MRPFQPDDRRRLYACLALPEVYAFKPGEPIDAATARGLAEERSRGSAFLAVELRPAGNPGWQDTFVYGLLAEDLGA